LAAEGKDDQAVQAFVRATQLQGEMQRRAWYELSQAYRHLGNTAEARAAVMKYEQLRQAADETSAKEAEDWRKLNGVDGAAPNPLTDAAPNAADGAAPRQ
jgi:lipopolysaccharide biosynthesis regulator YciM